MINLYVDIVTGCPSYLANTLVSRLWVSGGSEQAVRDETLFVNFHLVSKNILFFFSSDDYNATHGQS